MNKERVPVANFYSHYSCRDVKPTVYLSGPMAGRNWEDVEEDFSRYEDLFTMIGFKVLNPCKFDHTNTNDRELTLEEDFEQLRRADYIFMMPGWREAKGCNAEWGFARALHIIVLPNDEELESVIGTFMITTEDQMETVHNHFKNH